MSKDPAVLFYTSDFLAGTILMTYEEKGQYITLLCLQHQKGHLTEKELKQVTLSENVLQKFVLADDGKYHNIKMHSLTIKRKEYSASRSSNRLSKKENISTTQDNHMSNICQSHVQHMENGNGNVNETSIKSITRKEKIIVVQSPFDEAIENFVKMRKMIKKEISPKGIDLIKAELARLSPDTATQIKILNQSIMNSWQGVFELKNDSVKNDNKKPSQPNFGFTDRKTPQHILDLVKNTAKNLAVV